MWTEIVRMRFVQRTAVFSASSVGVLQRFLDCRKRAWRQLSKQGASCMQQLHVH